jgi:hypothetical protein
MWRPGDCDEAWSVQKQTLNTSLRRRITQDVPFGMAIEGLTAADIPH